MNYLEKPLPYKIYIYERELTTTVTDLTDIDCQKYYKERRVAEIGSGDYHSPISARNAKFVKNINGKNTLTFDLYYKYYDEEAGEFKVNPFIDMIKNETLLKLKVGNDWYDLIVTQVNKKTDKSVYSITAGDLYINELGKNGYQVELSTDLENNMGTVEEIGSYILQNSDWKVAPKIDDASDELKNNNIYSDTIIQKITEPLYQGILNTDISVTRLSQYRPDRLKDEDGVEDTIAKGEKVFFFYSDLINKRSNITVLYRPDDDYEISGLDQVVQNSYNYQITDVSYSDTDTIPRPTIIDDAPTLASDGTNFTKWRGDRVVQSTRSGYNFQLKRPIKYFSKTGDSTEYFGYKETDYISPTLTENYLSNCTNPSSIDDWYLADEADLVVKLQNNIYGAYATRYEVAAGTTLFNYGPQGHRKNIESLLAGDKFIIAFCYKTENWEDNSQGVYDYTNSSITDYEEGITHDEEYDAQFPTDPVNFDLGSSYYDRTKFGLGFCSIPPRSETAIVYSDADLTEEGYVIKLETLYSGDTYTVTDTKGRTKYYVYYEVEIPKSFTSITDLTETLTNPLCAIFEFKNDVKIYEIQFYRKKTFIHLEQVTPTDAIKKAAVSISNSREVGTYYYDKVYYDQYKKVDDVIQYDSDGQPIMETVDETKYYLCKEELVYPSYVPTEDGDLLRSYYYIYTNTYDPEICFRGNEAELYEAGYSEIIQENCEMVSSITKNKSNYFTLLSELTKQFNCWFKPMVIRDSETGEIQYKVCYYDKDTMEHVSDEEGTYPYFTYEDGNYIKHYEQVKYQWNKVTGTYNSSDDTLTVNNVTYSLKVYSQLEFEDLFGTDRTAYFTWNDVKDFHTEYIYAIMEDGIVDDSPQDNVGETDGKGEAYFVKLNRVYNVLSSSVELTALARPQKYICFCDYINANPNWAGFKYGVNVKSIARTDNNDKFATKVLVSNGQNDYAQDGFCSIARASENPTGDNFLFNFDYYVANNMIDYEDLQNDLNTLYTTLRECNTRNKAIIEQYAAAKVQKDIDESNYDTYFMAAQAAIQKMQDCFIKVRNCEHNDVYKTDELDINNWEPYAWQTGWCLEDVYKEEFNHTGSMTQEELASVPNNGWSYVPGILCDPDGNEHTLLTGYTLKSSYTFAKLINLLKVLTNDQFNPTSTDEAKEAIDYISAHSGTIYYFDTPKAREKLKTLANEGKIIFKESTTEQYFLITDASEEETKYRVFRFAKKNTEDVIIEKYCEMIDEYYTKLQIYSGLYPNYKTQLDSTKSTIESLADESEALVKKKTLVYQWFTDKYIQFIRESSWNSTNYIDDNLYYLDAVQNLSAAAVPKVSYTINVVDISNIVGAECYNFTVGDYTYIEDVDFFGLDEYNRPNKEWVVVTEHTISLDDPKSNQLKIQNYKSSLEDLFQRISATINNIETNQGKYTYATSGDSLTSLFSSDGALKINDGYLSFEKTDSGYTLIFIDKNGQSHSLILS